MPPTATPEPPKLPMAPDRPASPSGDEQKWKLDVKKLLEGMDAKDRLQCLAMANRVRIYKRLLVYVYVQLRYFQIDVSSIPSFTAHLASLEGWDGPKSLCKHDAIRRAIWETLQTQGIQVKTNQFVHFLPEMLVLDENDIALKVTTIIRDQEQKQEFVALCMEEPVPVIGLLQMLLDHDLVPNESKMLLVQTLARFAKMSATYPNSLLLRGVKLQGTHPVAGGGYSDIWKGTLGSQSVALKAFRIFFNDTSRIKNKILKDFCHEAVMWRQLRHKNILPFYGVFQGDETFDRLCLVSPWSEAGNIVDFLTSHPDSDRILLLSDVVDGLCYLHSFDPPVVHGDLKGANIFVTHSGIACLGDFGLTRFRDSQDNNIWQSTTGNASGTSRWTAPELLASDVSGQNIRANRASDIYSFGCVCLEVFTGNPPFSEILREAVVVMAIIQKQTPQRPFGDCVKHGLDDSMWDMISQCWHADPNLRPTVLQVSQFFRGKMGSLKENRTTVDDFPGAPSESLGQYGFSDEYVSHMTLQLVCLSFFRRTVPGSH
ncbi:kinase-like protein [Rickenella mellea]|uniref:Kinase-like protein n=1 Tax=Rickenella mellea TaxID=50990 RepID=A0A4Y7PKK8_9AGAM|nr:kinase-like protein [Rickenella mellea]